MIGKKTSEEICEIAEAYDTMHVGRKFKKFHIEEI